LRAGARASIRKCPQSFLQLGRALPDPIGRVTGYTTQGQEPEEQPPAGPPRGSCRPPTARERHGAERVRAVVGPSHCDTAAPAQTAAGGLLAAPPPPPPPGGPRLSAHGKKRLPLRSRPAAPPFPRRARPAKPPSHTCRTDGTSPPRRPFSGPRPPTTKAASGGTGGPAQSHGAARHPAEDIT
jgi:hypothetical protein